MCPTYKNKSSDFKSKSIDWFLYEDKIGCNWDNYEFLSYRLHISTEGP